MKEQQNKSSSNNNGARLTTSPVTVSTAPENKSNQFHPVVTQADKSALMEITPDTVNPPVTERKVNKSTRSRKTSLISSSMSRRTALALQQLEEEKQLREKREQEDRKRRDKRDAEYIEKKYNLLEEDLENEFSFDNEKLDRLKQNSVLKWTEEIQTNDRLAGIDDLSAMNLTEYRLTSSDVINSTCQSNRTAMFNLGAQISKMKTDINRLNRNSSSTIRKAKKKLGRFYHFGKFQQLLR